MQWLPGLKTFLAGAQALSLCPRRAESFDGLVGWGRQSIRERAHAFGASQRSISLGGGEILACGAPGRQELPLALLADNVAAIVTRAPQAGCTLLNP